MPIYEYRCEKCGKQFDALRSIKDADAPIPCKNCHSNLTHRKVSRCFSHSDSGTLTSGGGCGSCHGGSCSSCQN
ncbi:MAG: zinc ribbon domain-containing protein [Chloroflexi bacterium]|nr:zinc ribbon domain-containing protein [Chloroflexota bacterium]